MYSKAGRKRNKKGRENKMTTAQLNATGYIVIGREVKEITYSEYLSEYGGDETTSPNGIAPRMHIREVLGGVYQHVANGTMITEDEYDELSEEAQEWYNWYGEKVNQYQIWSWGVNGNHPSFTGTSFETEEEAQIDIYEYFESYIEHHNWDAPIFFNTIEEAITELANSLDRSEEVIKRYLKIAEITAAKNEALRIATEKINAENKAKMNAAVNEEVAILLPLVDEIFGNDVKEAQKLSGNDKSKACSAAFVSLLNRVGYGVVKSDFWKVFRAIK